MLTDFLTEISPALQNLLLAAITLFVGGAVAWIQKQYGIAKGKLSQEQQYLLDFLAERAVQAVEQLYKDEPSQRKRDEAVAIVQQALAGYGIKIEVGVIIASIEAEVFNKNSYDSAFKTAFKESKG